MEEHTDRSDDTNLGDRGTGGPGGGTGGDPVPGVPGCVSQGETRRNALENIADAIRACLEVRQELGMPLGVEVHEVEVAV